MQIGVLPFPLGCPFADLEESWQAAEEAGFHALWTIDHATPTAELTPSWEGSSLLVAMAARTRRIPVGILVFDVLLRHPFVLAGSVAVAQAVSGGRLRVGLGIGDRFSRLDHETLGVPFPPLEERVRVLDACCQVFPALWRGEAVTNPVLGLREASLGPTNIDPPPIIVGGGSGGVIDVAVRHAQGWNLFTQEPEEFGRRVELVARVEAAQGRTQPLPKSVYLFVDRVHGDLHRVLADFEAVGAEEAMLVAMRPRGESILNLARQLL